MQNTNINPETVKCSSIIRRVGVISNSTRYRLIVKLRLFRRIKTKTRTRKVKRKRKEKDL